MSVTYSNPLDWPTGWPRSSEQVSGNSRYRKKSGRGIMRPWSTSAAGDELLLEMERLGASDCKISSNLVTRMDGKISGNQPRIDDSGVAVYFTLNARPLVMANDRFWEPANNIRQLTIALQNLRHLSENGGAVMKERAFRGFAALPAPIIMGSDPAETLGIQRPFTAAKISAAYKKLAKQYHSDLQHGSAEKMSAINVARDEALREL